MLAVRRDARIWCCVGEGCRRGDMEEGSPLPSVPQIPAHTQNTSHPFDASAQTVAGKANLVPRKASQNLPVTLVPEVDLKVYLTRCPCARGCVHVREIRHSEAIRNPTSIKNPGKAVSKLCGLTHSHSFLEPETAFLSLRLPLPPSPSPSAFLYLLDREEWAYPLSSRV